MVNVTVNGSRDTLVTLEDGTVAVYNAGELLSRSCQARADRRSGDMSWVLTASALVALMSFGIGYLYSVRALAVSRAFDLTTSQGLLRRKNALSMIWLSMATFATVAVQWMLFGYSLAFSETGSSFMGDTKHFGLVGVLAEPSPLGGTLPRILFALYHMVRDLAPISAQ